VSRVLLAVESPDDAARLPRWITTHRFNNPVHVTILAVVPPLHQIMEPHLVIWLQSWMQESLRRAEALVKEAARAIASPGMTTDTVVRTGDPVTTVCDMGKGYDLLVVGSHGREGLDRFLLGSVSHGIVHRAGISVLVVR